MSLLKLNIKSYQTLTEYNTFKYNIMLGHNKKGPLKSKLFHAQNIRKKKPTKDSKTIFHKIVK